MTTTTIRRHSTPEGVPYWTCGDVQIRREYDRGAQRAKAGRYVAVRGGRRVAEADTLRCIERRIAASAAEARAEAAADATARVTVLQSLISE